jgi:hypothetical protein
MMESDVDTNAPEVPYALRWISSIFRWKI